MSFGFRKIPGKMKKDQMRENILKLCSGEFISLKELAALMQREQTFIHQQYISGLVAQKLLELKYPTL
jgi:hypothetical protein